MTRNEELEVIWQKAEKETPCNCGTDRYWMQDITGPIKCDRCYKIVTEEVRPIIERERERIRRTYHHE